MLENEQNLSSVYIASGAAVLEKSFLFRFWEFKTIQNFRSFIFMELGVQQKRFVYF